MRRFAFTAGISIALPAVAAIANLLGLVNLGVVIGALALSLFGISVCMAVGSLKPGLGFFGPTVNKGCRDGAVALTFDDGPIVGASEEVVAVLDAHKMRATFFLLVDRAEANPQLAQRIAQRHEVGLHGLHHDPWLTVKSPSAGSAELVDAKMRLEAVIGKPVVLYRPPFGAVSPRLHESVRKSGLQLIWCSVRTGDGIPISSDRVRSICAGAVEHDIILLHESSTTTRDVLPRVLTDLADRGLTSVTVGELCRSE